jgi:hypothetical protein
MSVANVAKSLQFIRPDLIFVTTTVRGRKTMKNPASRKGGRVMFDSFDEVCWWLVLVFVEKEIVLCGIVRPDLFNAFIGLAFVFQFLKVFDYLKRCSGTYGIVNKLIFCSRPRSVFQM